MNTIAEWFRTFVLAHEVPVSIPWVASKIFSWSWCQVSCASRSLITKLPNQFGNYIICSYPRLILDTSVCERPSQSVVCWGWVKKNEKSKYFIILFVVIIIIVFCHSFLYAFKFLSNVTLINYNLLYFLKYNSV